MTKLQELLRDLNSVNADLNSMKFNSETISFHMFLIKAKMAIEAELNQYSKEEREQCSNEQEIKKVSVVEDVELVKKNNRDFLYYLLMTYILMSESKNKLFLMLAVELFLGGETYEYKYTQKII